MTCSPRLADLPVTAIDEARRACRRERLANDRTAPARRVDGSRSASRRSGILRALLCVAAAGVAGPSAAELRVLLAFDGDGHRVHRVLRVGAVAPDPSRPAPRWKREPLAGAERAAAEATLRWLDAAGDTLALEHVPDPRLAHVPLGAGRAAGTPPIARAALSEGSWLVSGPDRAATLVLSLPARATPPLAPGEWTFELRR